MLIQNVALSAHQVLNLSLQKLQMLHGTTQNAKSYVRSLLLLKIDIKTRLQLRLINESSNTYGRCCRIKKAKHDYYATQQCQLKYDSPRSFWKGVRPRKHVDCPVDVQTFYAYFTEINTAHTNTTHINTNQQLHALTH